MVIIKHALYVTMPVHYSSYLKVKVKFLAVMLQGNSREVVAVKVVAKKTLNKASTENLLTEIEILKTVRHPHIVQLKDFQVRPFCIVREYRAVCCVYVLIRVWFLNTVYLSVNKSTEKNEQSFV